jgi:hypothetical protein
LPDESMDIIDLLLVTDLEVHPAITAINPLDN